MSSDDEEYDVYSPEFLAMLQSIWGDGFLAPGGTDAVDTLVREVDVSGKNVLDMRHPLSDFFNSLSQFQPFQAPSNGMDSPIPGR